MSHSFLLPRNLLILFLALPIAALAGYMLATPDFVSWGIVGMILATFILPAFLKWHHTMLILSWNLAIQVFFLPGSPPLWMLLAAGSLGMAVLGRVLDKERRLIFVPSVSWPLIIFGLIVFATMKMTGGVGIRSLGGGAFGGKKYICLLASIIAFFAVSCQQIPVDKWKSTVGAFFLPAIFVMASNLAYVLGPAFWFLFYLMPVDSVMNQVVEDFSLGGFGPKFGRLAGLAPAGLALYSYMLCRFGVRGILDWTRPWRFFLFIVLVGLSLLSGFRSMIVIYGLIFIVQFFLEGLHRTRALPVVCLTGLIMLIGVASFARHLPLSVQRCLTVFPIADLDPVARLDAEVSAQWRLDMWKVLLPEVSRYFWVGKGAVASEADYYLTMESVRRGLAVDYDMYVVSGDFHNGPLSVIIPYGIFGLAAFLVFLATGFRALILNYRFGEQKLQQVNTVLLSLFFGKVVFFCFIFGAVHLDLLYLVGLVGLSIALNGGICRQSATVPAPVKDPAPVPSPMQVFSPGFSRALNWRR